MSSSISAKWLDQQDFRSQQTALKWSKIIILIFSIGGFIVGYLTQTFQHAVVANLAGVALCILVG